MIPNFDFFDSGFGSPFAAVGDGYGAMPRAGALLPSRGELITASSAVVVGIDRERACRELALLARLPANWDRSGGVGPSLATICLMQSFIRNLPEGMRAPQVEPSGDGEINLVWRAPERYAEVGSNDGYNISYFAKTLADPVKRIFGDLSAGDPIPQVLLEHLCRFTNAAVRL